MSQKEHPRIARLRQEAQEIDEEVVKQSDLIQVRIVEPISGMPPDKYEVTYLCKGIIDHRGDEPIYGSRHTVNILLHEHYPMRAPALKWVTQIWHPNIHHITKDVCIDQKFWSPARNLRELILMMYDMVRCDNVHYDTTRAPYPLDHEAAVWYERYVKRMGWTHMQAVDTRSPFRPAGSPAAVTAPQPTSPATGGKRISLRSAASEVIPAAPAASIPPPPAAASTEPPVTASPSSAADSSGTRVRLRQQSQPTQLEPPKNDRIKIRK